MVPSISFKGRRGAGYWYKGCGMIRYIGKVEERDGEKGI